MTVINCPSCGAQLHPLANFCGACRKTLFQPAVEEPRAKLWTFGPTVLGFGLILVAVALVLGFLQLRGRQRSEAALQAGLNENAQPLKPLRSPNSADRQVTDGKDAAPSRSNPEVGPYGLPRELIGPTGNEAQAISALKAILNAQAAYFAETLTGYGTFDELVAHRYLKPIFRGQQPIVAGYAFSLSVANSADPKNPSFSFHVNADPVPDNGKRHFYIDEKGSIHYKLSVPATDKDPFEQYQ